MLAAIAFAASGCATTTGSTATTSSTVVSRATGTITVSAAASLTAPFTTIGQAFEKVHPGAKVTFNFDSSSTLARQIGDGGPADGFASADEANMKKVTDAGLIARTTVFARNRLTIVVKQGNPTGVTALADLADPAKARTVSLCGAEVPCGRYAEQVLQRANVTIPAERITRGQNVKATLAAVAEGDAEAGIAYATDVTGDKVEGVAIPDAQNAIAVYPIGTVTSSPNPATVDAFIAYVTSPPGQATLAAAGFLPPA